MRVSQVHHDYQDIQFIIWSPHTQIPTPQTPLSDPEAQLNFIGPTLLGLLDGITDHLATNKSSLLLEFTVNCVSRILQVTIQ